MTEYGVVVENDGKRIKIKLNRGEFCHGCTVCSMNDQNQKIMELDRYLDLQPGDMVEIEVDFRFTILSAFLVFILPLIGMFSGYFLFQAFVDIPGWPETLENVLGAVLGLGASIFLTYLVDKYLRGRPIRNDIRIKRLAPSPQNTQTINHIESHV